jgi:allophanate hydrolase subunit 1
MIRQFRDNRGGRRFGVPTLDDLKAYGPAKKKDYPTAPAYQVPDLVEAAREVKLEWTPPQIDTPQYQQFLTLCREFTSEFEKEWESGKKVFEMPMYWKKGEELCRTIYSKSWEEATFEERRRAFNYAAMISGQWAYIGIF